MRKLHTRKDEEMVLRGLRPKSRLIYLAAVRKFVEFDAWSPGVLGRQPEGELHPEGARDAVPGVPLAEA